MTALVVSGTSGSGSAAVRKIDESSGTVGFTYNSAEDEVEKLLSEIDDEHAAWQCDVIDADVVSETIDAAFETLGHVDAIIYTVGVISRSSVDELEPDDWHDHLDANITGAYNVINAAALYLKEQGEGAIAALSASDGVLSSDSLAAYDASKRGLEALVAETARDLGPHGVRANVVAPGYIRDPDALSEDQREDLLNQVPYDHITTPGDIADAYLYLCSEDAAAVTGVVLPVDSGLTL